MVRRFAALDIKENERTSYGSASIGVELGIDLVKEVERRRIAFLNRENWRARVREKSAPFFVIHREGS